MAISGSILDVKPTSEWFSNIRTRTAYRDTPQGRIPAIGVYELHSSGRFEAMIKCEKTETCCDSQKTISWEASVTSPTISASFEYDEIHLSPRSFMRYVNAGRILPKLYGIAKNSPEYIKWYLSLDAKKICEALMGA